MKTRDRASRRRHERELIDDALFPDPAEDPVPNVAEPEEKPFTYEWPDPRGPYSGDFDFEDGGWHYEAS